MIVIRKIVTLLLLSILITNKSCTCIGDPVIDIVDDYDVWTQDGVHWQFMCKLGCADHPKILDVQKVSWNDRTIVIQNKNQKRKMNWYIFHSPQSKIKCCHGNTILGPIDSLSMVNFLDENNVKKLKTKVVAK